LGILFDQRTPITKGDFQFKRETNYPCFATMFGMNPWYGVCSN